MKHRLRRMLLLLCLLSVTLVAGCRTRATYTVTLPPRFPQTTCVANPPAPRPGYPAASWAALQAGIPAACALPGRGGPLVSGVDFLATYDKVGGAGATDRAFQQITFVALERHTNNQCGDTPVPVIIRGVEYFNVPAKDLIADYLCCEEMTVHTIAGAVVIVDLASLPAGVAAALPPIPAGENAAFIDGNLTAAQLTQVRTAIRQNVQVSWGSRYEYDGCNPPPRSTTSCGRAQCLKLNWNDNNGQGTQSF